MLSMLAGLMGGGGGGGSSSSATAGPSSASTGGIHFASKTNYLPWIVLGLVVILGVFFYLKKKK